MSASSHCREHPVVTDKAIVFLAMNDIIEIEPESKESSQSQNASIAYVWTNFDGEDELVTLSESVTKLGLHAACVHIGKPMVIDLLLLKKAMELDQVHRKEYCDCCLRGDFVGADALLGRIAISQRKKTYNALHAYLRSVAEPTATVITGPLVVRMCEDAAAETLPFIEAALLTDCQTNTLVVCGVQHGLYHKQGKLDQVLASRIFTSRVASRPRLPWGGVGVGVDVCGVDTDDCAKPEGPVWIAVFPSDNRHNAAGWCLAASMQRYVKFLLGDAFQSACRVRVLYVYGNAAAGEPVHGLDVCSVLTSENDEKIAGDVAARWADNVCRHLDGLDPLKRCGFEVRCRHVVAPHNEGYFFVFAWAEDVFLATLSVLSDVVQSQYIADADSVVETCVEAPDVLPV